MEFILMIFCMVLILGSCLIVNIQLHDRIDKAIKYILECTEYDLFDSTLEECDKNYLIKILNGSDKE